MLNEKLNKYEIVLASSSPRRRQLMEQLDLDFRVESRQVVETFTDKLSPSEAAEYLSNLKADAFEIEELTNNELIITADTVVTINREILGKPADRADAIAMLQKLSGKTHQVITGVSLKTRESQQSFTVTTEVTFKKLSAEEVDFYVDHYQPYDKAGAYGIQEWIGHAAIERIEGSYFNVMGLPTHRLYEELLKFTG